ncbi:MAG: type 1 glutamine amidotransferase domain-containing protein [Dermatophilaceae bacterium]
MTQQTSHRPTRAVIVLTSHDRLGETGRSTGFYVPEVAHPWKVFRENGIDVDLVSTAGGRPPMDGLDDTDPTVRELLDDPQMSAKLAATPRPDQVDPSDYDVVLYAGGHGTMWDFPGDDRLAGLGREVYESGGVVAAVCHGPAGLVDITLSDGRYLVDGRRVAAFTNEEEAAVGLTDVVPFLLADRLVERGAIHVPAGTFQAQVIVDDRLVTGQNPASAVGVAEAIVAAVRASILAA